MNGIKFIVGIPVLFLFMLLPLLARVGIDSTGEKNIVDGLVDFDHNAISNANFADCDGGGITNITNAAALGGILAENWARKDLAIETFGGNLSVTTNISIGNIGQPSGNGAVHIGYKAGAGGIDVDSSGEGAMFIGSIYSVGAPSPVVRAYGPGAMNIGRVYCENLIYASGAGSINIGYFNMSTGYMVSNAGNASIALFGNDGTVNNQRSIIITNHCSMVFGYGETEEDNSILLDVVRARVNFIGNGEGLTNITNLGTFTNDVIAATNELNTLVANNTPVGSMVMYGAEAAPTGWLLCDGSAVSRTVTYDKLFAVISTTYGVGDGSTTFNTPDLRKRVAVGPDTGYALGAIGGYENVTLASNQIPSHLHGIDPPSTESGYQSANHKHTFTYNYMMFVTTGGTYKRPDAGTQVRSSKDTTTIQSISHTHTTDIAAFPSAEAGGGLSHSNMPPYIVVNYIIKY